MVAGLHIHELTIAMTTRSLAIISVHIAPQYISMVADMQIIFKLSITSEFCNEGRTVITDPPKSGLILPCN